MLESEVRQAHVEAAAKAFQDSGCKFFPGTSVVRIYKGKELYTELEKLGHDAMQFNVCKCKKLITVTLKQEWSNERERMGTVLRSASKDQ